MSTDGIDALLPSEQARFDEVCRFGQDKLEPIALTVARSFADDPIWQWIYDLTDTLPIERAVGLARMLVADRAPADEMHGFRHFGAVALWKAPVHCDPPPADETSSPAATSRRAARAAQYRKAFAEQVGERMSTVAELGAAMAKSHPDEPHWYLGILGTDPDRQNRGLGTRVLQAMHDRCDRTGVPSYLVSSNPRNYGFYRRHGYVEGETFRAADSPPLLPFWRSPR